MEIVFLLISVIISMSLIYLIGRLTFTHKELLRVYKTEESLAGFHFVSLLVLIILFFVTLCAFNNTFWNLSYLTK